MILSHMQIDIILQRHNNNIDEISSLQLIYIINSLIYITEVFIKI